MLAMDAQSVGLKDARVHGQSDSSQARTFTHNGDETQSLTILDHEHAVGASRRGSFAMAQQPVRRSPRAKPRECPCGPRGLYPRRRWRSPAGSHCPLSRIQQHPLSREKVVIAVFNCSASGGARQAAHTSPVAPVTARPLSTEAA